MSKKKTKGPIGLPSEKAKERYRNARKKAESSEKGNETEYVNWKDDGEKRYLRIMPPWTLDPDDDFFLKFEQHWGLGASGKRVGRCDGTKENCPVHAKIWDERDEVIAKWQRKLKTHNMKLVWPKIKKDPEWNKNQQMGGRSKYALNVVEFFATKKKNGKTKVTFDDKIKIATVGQTVISDILRYFDEDLEWGVFWDPSNRYDFVIERSGTGFQDTSYSVTPTRRFAEVDTDHLVTAEHLYDLTEKYAPHTYAQLEKLLGGEDLDDSDWNVEDDTPKKKKKKKKKVPDFDAPKKKKKKKASKYEDDDIPF